MNYLPSFRHIGTTVGIAITSLTLSPLVSFAQSDASACSNSFNTIADIFVYLVCVLNAAAIPLIITVALIMFFAGIVKFIANSDDETKRKEGRQFMLWGIIALFVMLSIWGILQILANTFGFDFGVPQFQT